MASGTLVFVELDGGKPKKTAFELVGKAKSLGLGPVSAVVIGGGDLSGLDVAKAYVLEGDVYARYTTDAYAKALAHVINLAQPALVLGPASPVGKDLFPRVSARIGAGMISEVTALSVDGGKVVGQRPVYAGKALVSCTVKSATALVTVRPNSFTVPAPSGAPAEVVKVDAGVSAADIKAAVVEQVQSASTVADLTEADRIVSGGRSLKSKEDFDRVVRPLAASIGATPGASRACVDAGFAPHSAQVGQTGKVVNPTLYIALGISGAIQHLAGMRTSKVIVCVNKDKDAPLFQYSSYGIVDDLFVIAPLLQKELEAL